MSSLGKPKTTHSARGVVASLLFHALLLLALSATVNTPAPTEPTEIISLDVERIRPQIAPAPAAAQTAVPLAKVRVQPASTLAHRAVKPKRVNKSRPAAKAISVRRTTRPTALREGVGSTLQGGGLDLRLRGKPSSLDSAVIDLKPRPEDFAGIPTIIAKKKLNEGRIYAEDPDEGKLASQKYPLKRDHRGDLVHQDETMIAKIKKDGRLTFKDRPNLRGDFLPDIGDTIKAARKDPWQLLRGRPGSEKGGLKIVKGQFDFTDALMRSVGEDPYAYNKRCFARATQKLRVKMRRADHHSKLDGALVQMAGQLKRLWNDPLLSKPKLRRLLFELWDECQDSSAPAADDLAKKRLVVAERVRWMISCFIRRHLPAGSRHAYTNKELKRLNRHRSSVGQFVPYGKITPPC
jgi:hypothetical protein